MDLSISKLFEAIGVESKQKTVHVLMVIEGGRVHVEPGTSFTVTAISPADVRQGFINQQVKHDMESEGLDQTVDKRQIDNMRAEYQHRCGKISMADPRFKKIDSSVEYQMRCDDAIVLFSTKEFDMIHWSHVAKHPQFRSMFFGR